MNYKTEIKKTKEKIDFRADFSNKKSLIAELTAELKNDSTVKEAAELLKKGEIVALPTETVYGLAADALNVEAVQKIFAAKGRPQDNPLIVHIADRSQLDDLVTEIPKKAELLMDKFWPGPLTIIFSKSSNVPEQTSAGLATVAVRMPAHPIMLAVIEKANLALAAPSANRSGFPSPTKAEHVFNDLQDKIPLIVDGGPCRVGVESTVIDLRGAEIKVLRPGGISRQQLADYLNEEVILTSKKLKKDQKVISPGMKYRHYAPEKKLFVFNFEDKFSILKKALLNAENKKIALITAKETEIDLTGLTEANIKILKVFKRKSPEKLAQKLFSLLRDLDSDPEVAEIYIEEIDQKGMGEAVMNRVLKAAAAENDFQPGGGGN